MLNDTLNYNTLLSKTTENSIHWMQKQLSGLGIKEDFRKTVTQFQHCLGQTAACFNNLKKFRQREYDYKLRRAYDQKLNKLVWLLSKRALFTIYLPNISNQSAVIRKVCTLDGFEGQTSDCIVC